MKKQEFNYLEIELTDDVDDCDITNEINKQLKSLYEDCKYYKIINFETKILNSKSRYKTVDHFPILGILVLVEFK